MNFKRAWIALLLLFIIVAINNPLSAQENLRIVDIEVEGNQRASRSLILGVSSFDIGSTLSPTDITQTVQRLYGLGIFSDIKVEAEQQADGVKLYIVLSELPKLIGIEFIGNDKIKDKDLKEKLGIGVGGYISPNIIHDKKNQIKKIYAEKGYFQAQIGSGLVYNDDSTEATLTFNIEEKNKVKVKEVVVTGNKRVSTNSLIKKMRNRKRGFLKSSDFAQEKYAEDLEKVIETYHNKGFIDAYLISDSTSIDSTDNKMIVYLKVYEGPQYYFGNAEFVDNDKIRTEFLKKQLKHKIGDTFNQEEYDESIYEIYSAYQEIGHLHSQVIDERTTRNDSLIDITYRIVEGLPSKINEVKIVGNTKTKDYVIRRELSTLPGSTFNRSLLIRSVRDAMALNYFTNINPVPINLPSGDVDVEFQIEEKQTGQVSAGAGYNSQDKLVGTVGMSIPNFRGNGQNVSFNVEFGSQRESFILSFTEPWFMGRPTLIGSDMYTTNRQWFDEYTEGRHGGSIKIGRRLRWPDNYFRIFGSVRIEKNRYHDFDDYYTLSNSYKYTSRYVYTVPSIEPNVLDTVTVDSTYARDPYPGTILSYNEEWLTAARLSLTITRDSRNLPEFATTGSLFKLTLENTGGFLGGYWEYKKYSISFAKFFPVYKNIALAAKVQFGRIYASVGDDHISLSDRFTPGGTAYDGIVRGYEDGSLTPDSSITLADTIVTFDGSPDSYPLPIDTLLETSNFTTRVRGKYMLITNVELQIPIISQQIYLLGFLDAGDSWLHKNDIKPFNMHRGVGFGIRVVVPMMGTIGFDFAKRLDSSTSGEKGGWKTHFQMGTIFR
ncbi:MAG: outer membrane protein assembly factor BamA [Candidatus Zixiibacteriota bacterium]|nr:MAG: outer membrane protein assembly factor BamA [candidate division Zixibacteria bacterium]